MDFNLITSILAAIIATLALIVSYIAVRFQYVAIINTQLADCASRCNEQLTDSNKNYVPKENDKISGILSGIITAEEILNSYLLERNPFLLNLNSQRIIDHFYLQLHTTIRVYVEKEELESSDLSNSNRLDVFNKQLKRVQGFLGGSITKNKNGEFEKLNKVSIKR
ncbi:MAG: hypothetical protein Q8R57_09200 [Bacteroidota bacterium]|nr:hypothetical protein [Bacteroidota bacterium]